METAELCRGCNDSYARWKHANAQYRRDWEQLYPGNQLSPPVHRVLGIQPIVPYHVVPFGHHSCQLGLPARMGEPFFAMSKGNLLPHGLGRCAVRLRLYICFLAPDPGSYEACRSKIPLFCRLPLYGGLLYHWGEYLKIRGNVDLEFGRHRGALWAKCRSDHLDIGTTGPIKGDLKMMNLELVALGTFGPREDVDVDCLFLQWLETQWSRNVPAREMIEASWL